MASTGKRLTLSELAGRVGGIPSATLTRWARAGEVPGAYALTRGKKTRWRFPDTLVLRNWIDGVIEHRAQKPQRAEARMSRAHRMEYRRREAGKKLGYSGAELKRFQKGQLDPIGPMPNPTKRLDDADNWLMRNQTNLLKTLTQKQAKFYLHVRFATLVEFVKAVERIAQGQQ